MNYVNRIYNRITTFFLNINQLYFKFQNSIILVRDNISKKFIQWKNSISIKNLYKDKI